MADTKINVHILLQERTCCPPARCVVSWELPAVNSFKIHVSFQAESTLSLGLLPVNDWTMWWSKGLACLPSEVLLYWAIWPARDFVRCALQSDMASQTKTSFFTGITPTINPLPSYSISVGFLETQLPHIFSVLTLKKQKPLGGTDSSQ